MFDCNLSGGSGASNGKDEGYWVKDESVAVETLFLFHPSAFIFSIACAARP